MKYKIYGTKEMDGSPMNELATPVIVAEERYIDLEVRFAVLGDVQEIQQIAERWFTAETLIDDATVIAWVNREANMFRVVTGVSSRTGRRDILGYYSVMAMRNDTLAGLVREDFAEKDMDADLIFSFRDPAAQCLYVADLAKAEGQSNHIGGLLQRDLIRYLWKLMRENDHLEKIGIWAWSQAGNSIANRLGFSKLAVYQNGTTFFEISRDGLFAMEGDPGSAMGRFAKASFKETYTPPSEEAPLPRRGSDAALPHST